jgi:zeta-carotene isomerase
MDTYTYTHAHAHTHTHNRLAVSCIVFFINHRYDGVPLWDLKLVPGVHAMCWVLSFISFWFLYP